MYVAFYIHSMLNDNLKFEKLLTRVRFSLIGSSTALQLEYATALTSNRLRSSFSSYLWSTLPSPIWSSTRLFWSNATQPTLLRAFPINQNPQCVMLFFFLSLYSNIKILQSVFFHHFFSSYFQKIPTKCHPPSSPVCLLPPTSQPTVFNSIAVLL